MKKILTFISLSLILSSCVLDETQNSNRTSDTLSNFTQELCDLSVGRVVYDLDELSESEDILSENYSKTYRDEAGYDLTINKVAGVDSTWTVVLSYTSDEIIKCTSTVRMLPDDANLLHEWKCSASGSYSEKDNDYTADFASDGQIKLIWQKSKSTYSYSICFDLVRNGLFNSNTYYKEGKLDWCNLRYTNDYIEYNTSRGKSSGW